jgi:fructose-1,6-bisphosphatase II
VATETATPSEAAGRGGVSPCPCTELVSVTESCGLAAGRHLGRGDAVGADRAASSAMAETLSRLPLTGRVAIGREVDDHPLQPGTVVGGGGPDFDLACAPVEGATVVARGGAGALSVLAASEPGAMASFPRMYMKKMAVGPVARGRIDLHRSVTENLEAIADAYGRNVADVTAIVLDRPRHEDLIGEIRDAGARIKLIADGDITAAITVAVRGTNDHLAVGIGGSLEGVLSAAALHCLGGEIQGQLWPTSRTQIKQAHEHGVDDIAKVFAIDDLVRGHQIVVATGISNGDLLRGVRFFADGARTHSIVLCSRCNRVRFVDSIHLFSRARLAEIRL